jgi:hypothetical protein
MRDRWCVVVMVAACSSQQHNGMPTTDAAVDGANAPDGIQPDAAPLFTALHLDTSMVLVGAPDLTLGSATTIDTTALTIGGAANAFFVEQDSYAVLYTGAFDVQADITVVGALPLIVSATGQIEIEGNVSLFGHDAVPGPGAPAASPGAGGSGTSANVGEGAKISSGGGGGSYGSLGALGFAEYPTTTSIGTIYGGSIAGLLIGGAPGGDGGEQQAPGVGGGALQLSSAMSITVGAFAINAGGGGGGAALGIGGGGGGGAGGEIILEAPTMAVLGAVTANGGGGGGGGPGDGNAQAAQPGQNGQPNATPASGGIGGMPQGAPGGSGAAGVSGSFVEAATGNLGGSIGGGGGGGAGRIWLRYRSTTPPTVSGAVISPPAETDATFP